MLASPVAVCAGVTLVALVRAPRRDASSPRPCLCDYAAEERSVDDCQIVSLELSVSAGHEFVLDPLAFVEALQSRAFNGGDVDKHIIAALVGLDETVPYGWFEPLYDPGRHDHFLSLEYSSARPGPLGVIPPRMKGPRQPGIGGRLLTGQITDGHVAPSQERSHPSTARL